MANTKSAQKAQRQTERRTLRNRSARSSVKTYVKKATAAVADGEQLAAEAVRLAVRALDKAARKGIIHPNNAARRKGRLMSRLHALSVAVPETTAVAVETPQTRSRRRAAAEKTPSASARKRAPTAGRAPAPSGE